MAGHKVRTRSASGTGHEVDLTALESEWAVLLEQAIGASPEGVSMEDIASKLQLGMEATRRHVRHGIAAGTVVCAGKVPGTRSDGTAVARMTPVYRIVGK